MARDGQFRKPRIGVTGSQKGSAFSWCFIWINVLLAGGRAKFLKPSSFVSPEGFDGFVIAGGADVDPALYGETLKAKVRKERRLLQREPVQALAAIFLYWIEVLMSRWRHIGLDPARDEMEFQCLDFAVKNNLPVLGICRGCQLINVYFQGSLFQSIRDFYVETPQIRSYFPRKVIHVEPHTTLGKLLGKREAQVNSLHNQSIRELGKGIKASALETNGIIQAIEHSEHEFLIGVQWHPEFLVMHPQQRKIFAELAASARRRISGLSSSKILRSG
jgi:putative glutamine amidotransferase